MALRLFINYILAGSTSANGYMLVAELVMLFAGPALTYYALDRWVLPFLQRALTGADADAERAPRRYAVGGRISRALSPDYRRLVTQFRRTAPQAQPTPARAQTRAQRS